jgi:hypothetical protein
VFPVQVASATEAETAAQICALAIIQAGLSLATSNKMGQQNALLASLVCLLQVSSAIEAQNQLHSFAALSVQVASATEAETAAQIAALLVEQSNQDITMQRVRLGGLGCFSHLLADTEPDMKKGPKQRKFQRS